VDLGTAGDFAVLSTGGYVTATDSFVTGSIGAKKAVTFVRTAFVTYGNTYENGEGSVLQTAFADFNTAYANVSARPAASSTETDRGTTSIGGLTFTQGTYQWNSHVNIDGDIFLKGTATDVFIIRVVAYLAVAADVKVHLVGGTVSTNVVWQVGGYVSIGARSVMEGTLLVNEYISFGAAGRLNGRALANGYVVLPAATVDE
ncbi:hypothetical protein T492DRAFT_571152, partial [Pavlovales sp. CCMP2436]